MTRLAIWEAGAQFCPLVCLSGRCYLLLASNADVAYKVHAILLKALSDKVRMFHNQSLHYRQHCAGARLTNFPSDCADADTPEEKARKLAKKACLPPSKFPSFDLLQSIAGQYQLSMDGMHPGLPAGFTAFTAAGTPDANGMHSVMIIH